MICLLRNLLYIYLKIKPIVYDFMVKPINNKVLWGFEEIFLIQSIKLECVQKVCENHMYFEHNNLIDSNHFFQPNYYFS